jgi:hypothetical protein
MDVTYGTGGGVLTAGNVLLAALVDEILNRDKNKIDCVIVSM